MKIFYMIFIALSSLSGNAQTIDSMGTIIEHVLKLKHAYEASLKYSKNKPTSNENINREIYDRSGVGNIETTFAAYTQGINSIKANKKQYATYLENVGSGEDSLRLSERFVVYDYESPLNSIHDKNNILTKLSYYKMFKYFILDLNRPTLPTLKEALEYIKE